MDKIPADLALLAMSVDASLQGLLPWSITFFLSGGHARWGPPPAQPGHDVKHRLHAVLLLLLLEPQGLCSDP